MKSNVMPFLDELESESIEIIREVRANFENPILLFSGGKDSIVLSHLIKKAFYPAKIPFDFVHVDTGHNFPETIRFRDELVKKLDVNLEAVLLEDYIKKGLIKEQKNINSSRNELQIPVLNDFIEKNKIDAAIGGARRDEEKSRAKERFFSHRDEFGQWDPKNQRPEVWKIFNTNLNEGEHFRVFPISNWTEMDIWNYIQREKIDLPSLYFSHKRKCIEREGKFLAISEFINIDSSEKVVTVDIRFRTCGDLTITGGLISKAKTVEDIIEELGLLNTTERESRFDDKKSENSMEERKKKGYF